MKMVQKTKVAAVLLAFSVLPMVAYGASLIPCGGDGTDPLTSHPCGFNDLLVLANNIVHFLMYDVAVPLAAIGFMWAGANLVLNQDKESAWSEAKGRFTTILTGFGIMLGSYILIKTILYTFLNTDAGFTLFLLQ